MMDRAPSCVILHNRNELKVYQGNQVYLNDGDNFELRFFNPTQEKIGVEILFNSTKKGDGYLVLNPGQDLILDRFLDEQRKMLFETYVVDGNNEAAVKAIQQNGVISFNFYKEYHRSNYVQNDVNINYDFAPKPYRYTPPAGNTYVTNNYFGVSGSSFSGLHGALGVAGPAGAAGFSGTGGSGGSTYTTNTTNISSTTTSSSPNYKFTSRSYSSPGIFANEVDQSVILDSLSFAKDYWFPSSNGPTPILETLNPLETGRIEKGDISNQKLKNINAQFASTPFHSITYKLMPISAMNRTVKEVREYCGECGYRVRKQTWQYCPKCGSHLE